MMVAEGLDASLSRRVSQHLWTRRATFILCAIVLTISYWIHTPTIGYDGTQYLVFAQNLLQTGTFTYDGTSPSCARAPGYPAFLAAILWATGGLQWAYAVQMGLLFVALWAVAHSLGRYLKVPAGMGLLLSLVLVWPLHRMGMTLMTEPLFLAMTSVALLLWHRFLIDRNRLSLITAVFLLALSAYVRPINLFAPFALGGYLMWRRRLSWQQGLLVAAVGLLTVLPWGVRNYALFDRGVPMAAHYGSLYYMTDADTFWPVLLRSAGHTHSLPIHEEIVGDDLELSLEVSDRYMARARQNIARDPLGFLGRCVVKTAFIWSYLPGTKAWLHRNPVVFGLGVAVQWIFLILGVRGLRALQRRGSPLSDVVIAYTLYTTAALFPFYGESRFLLPIYIWLFGAAWYWLVERFRPAWINPNQGTHQTLPAA